MPRYVVRSTHHPRGHAEPVPDADDALDAALAYAERWPPAEEEQEELSVTVQDCESGSEYCFRISLSTGEAEPC